jgi:O-antigen/teichoic acid export membrane protein
MAYTLVAATQPMLALGAAVAPRLAVHFHADRRRYRALVGGTVLAAVALGLVTVVAAAVGGRAFLRLAYGTEFAGAAQPIVWLAGAAAANFVAAAFSYAATAARRIGEQSVVALLAFGVCLAASVLLVPAHGLVGAAWAVCATEATRAVCLGVVCGRVLASGAGRRMSAVVMPPPRVADVTR